MIYIFNLEKIVEKVYKCSIIKGTQNIGKIFSDYIDYFLRVQIGELQFICAKVPVHLLYWQVYRYIIFYHLAIAKLRDYFHA